MNAVIRRDDSVIVREVDGEILVLDTSANQVHQLNRTASTIWRLCGERASPESMAAALAAEYEVDEPTAMRDLLETLRQLRSLNLLVDL